MHQYSFERLEVWKQAKELCVFVYKITGKFPGVEKFGITSQMRRAAVSIASNIAEGSARMSPKDKSHFYTIAYSSSMELLNQLIISSDLMFILETDLLESRQKIEEVTKGLSALRHSTLNSKP